MFGPQISRVPCDQHSVVARSTLPQAAKTSCNNTVQSTTQVGEANVNRPLQSVVQATNTRSLSTRPVTERCSDSDNKDKISFSIIFWRHKIPLIISSNTFFKRSRFSWNVVLNHWVNAIRRFKTIYLSVLQNRADIATRLFRNVVCNFPSNTKSHFSRMRPKLHVYESFYCVSSLQDSQRFPAIAIYRKYKSNVLSYSYCTAS